MAKIRPLALLTIVGIALVGISAGVVSGLNAKQKAYTVRELAAHWKAPYDLLVLPKGSTNLIGKVADPNAIDEGTGGITLRQWHTIQKLKGVAVAAPLVPLGLDSMAPLVGPMYFPGGSGFFRSTDTFRGVGLPSSTRPMSYVSIQGNVASLNYTAGLSPMMSGLIVAVDPQAEERLVGMEGAVTSGGYLSSASTDIFERPSPLNGLQSPTLFNVPALLSVQSPEQGSQTFTVERLDLPFSQALAETYLARNGKVPANVQGTVDMNATIKDTTVWNVFKTLMTNPTVRSMAMGPMSAQQYSTLLNFALQKPSSVTYQQVASPFPKRWPVALKAIPAACKGFCKFYAPMGEPFRSLSFSKQLQIQLRVVGIYNPTKLKIAVDPLTHLPLVNYRPEEGRLVLTPEGNAVNPPQLVLPGNSPLGLFNPMPTAVVGIQNVLPILGKAPISSIRVKAAGVDTFSLGAQAQLQAIADRIHQATGLTVEIVRGAAPQQVIVHPGYMKGYTHVGWIQEEWVRLGAGIEILRQTLLSQDVILIPVLFGAFVFSLTAGVIGVEVRRKEYATLLSLGVLPRTIRGSVLREGLLYAGVVLVLTLGSAYAVGRAAALVVTVPVGILAGIVMFLALVPVARATSRIDPLDSLKETTPALARALAPVSIVGMGLSLFLSSIRRHVASLVALLVPGAVFYLIFLVQSALSHTLYLTTLGQYLLVQVGPLMALGAIVAAALAILASAQIGMRNAALRARTWAIGHAMDWPRLAPILASLVESGIIGLIAGLLGASAGAIVGGIVFGAAFLPQMWALAVGAILFSGLLAALPATFVIARQEPVTHLRGAGQ